jgi:acyl carrier protein
VHHRGGSGRPNCGEHDYIIVGGDGMQSPEYAVRARRAFLDTRNDVLTVLDDVLSLKGRSQNFPDDMRLMNGLPELDSMAVANILAALEERFGFVIDDDEIDGSTFETIGSLVAFVRGKLKAAR